MSEKRFEMPKIEGPGSDVVMPSDKISISRSAHNTDEPPSTDTEISPVQAVSDLDHMFGDLLRESGKENLKNFCDNPIRYLREKTDELKREWDTERDSVREILLDIESLLYTAQTKNQSINDNRFEGLTINEEAEDISFFRDNYVKLLPILKECGFEQKAVWAYIVQANTDKSQLAMDTENISQQLSAVWTEQ